MIIILQDKTNEAEIKQALDVLCYGLSTPVHKECIKLVSQYTDELVDMIVHEYPPKYEGKHKYTRKFQFHFQRDLC